MEEEHSEDDEITLILEEWPYYLPDDIYQCEYQDYLDSLDILKNDLANREEHIPNVYSNLMNVLTLALDSYIELLVSDHIHYDHYMLFMETFHKLNLLKKSIEEDVF